MNKKFLIGALAMAGLALGGQTNSQATSRINTVNEVKAIVDAKKSRRSIAINAMGGLDSAPLALDYGNQDYNWKPKMGHVKRKTNKQRCSHNAKLKRRR